MLSAARSVADYQLAIDRLSPKAKELVESATRALAFAIQMSERAPTGPREMRSALGSLRDVLNTLDRATDTLERIAGPDCADLVRLYRKLLNRLEDIHGYGVELLSELDSRKDDKSTLSENKLFGVMSLWAQAAETFLEARLPECNPKQAMVLRRALEDVRSHRLNLDTRGSLEDMTPDEFHEKMGSPPKGVLSKVPGPVIAMERKLEKIAAEKLFKNVDYTARRGIELPEWQTEIREQIVLASLVEKALVQAGIPVPRDILAELTSLRRDILNNRPWKTIKGTLRLEDDNGNRVKINFVSTPQSSLGETYRHRAPGGTNSHMTRVSRCPTLYRTVIALDGDNLTAAILYSGIRHGVLVAYGITGSMIRGASDEELQKVIRDCYSIDGRGHLGWARKTTPKERELIAADLFKTARTSEDGANFVARLLRSRATWNRVHDLVTSALVADPEKLREALSGKTVALTLNSVALLTPSKITSNEIQMVEEQIATLQALGNIGNPVRVELKDDEGGLRIASVKVRVRTFNFGGNLLAAGFGGPAVVGSDGFFANVINGWAICKVHNDLSIDSLLGDRQTRELRQVGGDVAAWLTANEHADPNVRAIVRELALQIGEMYDSGQYRESNPYEIISRLSLLAFLMGETSCFNCKSGKDRTGLADSMIKFLALRIALTGKVPIPFSKLTTEEAELLFKVLMKGGSIDIQIANTGAPGYKVNLPWLKKVLGKYLFAIIVGISNSMEGD